MSVLLSPECLPSLLTAIAGVTLFSLAPFLPSAFPPAFTRLVGLGAALVSLLPLYVYSESLTHTVLTGGLCLAVIVGVHVWQTCRKTRV